MRVSSCGCFGGFFQSCFSRTNNPNNGGGSQPTAGNVEPTQTENQSATQERPEIGGVNVTYRPNIIDALGEDSLGLVFKNINRPDHLNKCLKTNKLLRDLCKKKLQEFHRRVNDKLATIKTELADINDDHKKTDLIRQKLNDLISPDLSPESFIELEVAKKLINEFPNDIGNACQVAIKQLLELNRVDDALNFFNSIPLNNNCNYLRDECLKLLNSHNTVTLNGLS